ncbi:MAG: hypothetical protein HY763_07770 [Planctomycetes bacterium]|nr:hypothetical protein [Planctomycetota bacterium]
MTTRLRRLGMFICVAAGAAGLVQCSRPRTSPPGPGRAPESPPRSVASEPVRTPPDRAALRLPALQPRLGEPLRGLTIEQRARFVQGKTAFSRIFSREDGLGPAFNMHSCMACHSNPLGGAGSSTITLFGREVGSIFDPLAELGGPMIQGDGHEAYCGEEVPSSATITAHRLTPTLLGAGLVEAIPDELIKVRADHPPAGLTGRVQWTRALEDPPGSAPRVGRFGFKGQLAATLLTCTAISTRAEMGLTNRFLPQEDLPGGDPSRVPRCDSVADPELRPGPDGRDDVDRMTDFQRYLAAAPQTPRSGMSGEAIFVRIGCADCHTPSFVTSDDPALEDAVRGQTLKPYSDFLLHYMGAGADGIAQGEAGQWEMRTMPLWGFRIRFPVYHDGRIAGATVAERAERSIELHAGEAEDSLWNYQALSPPERAQLIAFLDSLGRVEFDDDGDNDVDVSDYAAARRCLSGVRRTYSPDDRCSLSDIDQDGDVDMVDQCLLQHAFTGPEYGSTTIVP